MPKKFLIAANWKMHPMPPGAVADGSPYRPHKDVDVVVLPNFLNLEVCCEAELNAGAQCARPEDTGAFSGDIGMGMLAAINCKYVMCGHSERRKNHGETDEYVHACAASALKHGIIPIVCIGETWDERKAGKEKDVIEKQMKTAVMPLIAAAASHGSLRENLVIAYEPVWAISGGDKNKPAATPNDAQQMHAFIRSLLPENMRSVRIIYGGSMKPQNAKELLRCADIDGGLVGQASLDPMAFGEVVEAAIGLTPAR